MVRRIPIHNAVKNQPEILEGEVVDEIREPSVFVDRNGKSYDASRGLKFGDLPNEALTQLPRTSWYDDHSDARPTLPNPVWYGFRPEPFDEDVVIVGWWFGGDGCIPIYARRSDGKDARIRGDALRNAAPDKPRRNWRARKAARESGALELPNGLDRGSSGT